MAEKKRFIDDFEEYEVTEDHHPSKIGTVIRVIFYSLILLVNCAIIFRVCMADDPREIKSLAINDTLREAYAESADDFRIYTQTVYDMYTKDGIYYASGLFFCPTADQLQISIRYNVRTADDAVPDSVLTATTPLLLSDFGVMRLPSLSGQVVRSRIVSSSALTERDMREGDFFTFRLTDDFGNYYDPSGDGKLTRLLYVYHKLTFDGLTDEETNFYVEIYPLRGDTPDYDTVLGRMKVYSIERPSDEYSLSGSERSKLS